MQVSAVFRTQRSTITKSTSSEGSMFFLNMWHGNSSPVLIPPYKPYICVSSKYTPHKVKIVSYSVTWLCCFSSIFTARYTTKTSVSPTSNSAVICKSVHCYLPITIKIPWPKFPSKVQNKSFTDFSWPWICDC